MNKETKIPRAKNNFFHVLYSQYLPVRKQESKDLLPTKALSSQCA